MVHRSTDIGVTTAMVHRNTGIGVTLYRPCSLSYKDCRHCILIQRTALAAENLSVFHEEHRELLLGGR